MVTDIAQVLQDKAGLSPEQSHEVAHAVLDCVKSKVPPQFQGILGSVFGGETATTADGQPAPTTEGGLGGLIGEATSIFGHKS